MGSGLIGRARDMDTKPIEHSGVFQLIAEGPPDLHITTVTTILPNVGVVSNSGGNNELSEVIEIVSELDRKYGTVLQSRCSIS
jgi:hypothetical protein